jgi:outer membrane protein assembly factor BamB
MFVLFAVCFVTARADDWPAWRGPTGQGFCLEKDVPLKWSDKENVKWKVSLAHQGNSTPIVWKDKIFLTQATTGGTVRSLLCLARADGKTLWQKDVPYAEKEQNWNQSWYANASPVTDGERVIVSLGSAGMHCYELDGKELWKRTDLGHWTHEFGNASSPVIYNELAILWCGPNKTKGRNFLLAVEKKTGKTVWEHDEKDGSWGTPLITQIEGKDQLLLGMGPHLKGFDPKNGKELWKCEGLTSYVYTSPVYGNGMAAALSGYGGAGMAVKLGGEGDITKNRLWRHPKNIQRVGSGMIVGDHLYIVEESGVPHCYDLKTGDEVWKVTERPGGTKTWGSMVHAEDRLYVLMFNGETLVLDAKPTYKLLAVNSLGAGVNTNSSIVVSNGEIFIRTFKHLYCIGKK